MKEQIYRYNAFISYRRSGRDLAVAREIQTRLERCRLPRSIQKRAGKVRLGRVFRDTEELQLSSDLSGRIEEALQESEFLIVICSPRYLESPWCLHEVASFLQTHDRDQVLCVLAEGEPPAIFPEILLSREEAVQREDGTDEIRIREMEPIACDYRGDFKTAARVELPRLVSKMLGCRYDELVQRQEKYRRRRLAAVLGGTAMLAAAAITWLLWSNARISDNYRHAQISESRLLSIEAMEAFDSRNRKEALELALSALPDETVRRPVTDEAVYALSTASYAYRQGMTLESWRVDGANDIESFFISRDGNYLVCLDRCGEFRTVDLRSRQDICRFCLPVDHRPSAPAEGRAGELLICTDEKIYALDYLHGTVSWEEELAYRGDAAGSPVKADRSGTLAAIGNRWAVLIMQTNGTPVMLLPLPEDAEYTIADLCWSPDGGELAVKLHATDGSLTRRMGFFEIETSAFHLTEEAYPEIPEFGYVESGAFWFLGIRESGGETEAGKITVPCELQLCRLGSRLWKQVLQCRGNADCVSLAEDEDQNIDLGLGKTLSRFNREGELLESWETDENIRQVLLAGTDAIVLVTEGGTLESIYPEIGFKMDAALFRGNIRQLMMLPNVKTGGSTYLAFSDGMLCFYDTLSDETIRFLEADGFSNYPGSFLREGNRVLLLADDRLAVYDLAEERQMHDIPVDPGHALHLLTVRDGKAYLLKINADSGFLSLLSCDLNSGVLKTEEVFPVRDDTIAFGGFSYPIPAEFIPYFDLLYTGPAPAAMAGDCLWMHGPDAPELLLGYRLADGTVQELDLTDGLGQEKTLMCAGLGHAEVSPLVGSPDGKFLLSIFTAAADGKQIAVLIDTEAKSVMELPEAAADLTAITAGDDCFAYVGERALLVYGTDGAEWECIPWTGDAALAIALRGRQIYCVFPDGTLHVFEGGKEIRSLQLSLGFEGMRAGSTSSRMFRFCFTETRLYLYFGNTLNVISLDADSTRPLFTAGSVITELPETGALLACWYRPDRMLQGDYLYYPGLFGEYTTEELVDRGRSQLAAYGQEDASQ